jgi:hypothetical protein
MTSVAQKLNLTAHIASSVGWLGAVASFLALSIAGLTSRNPETVRSSYLAMELLGAYVVLPLSLLALLTGLVQSVGSHWGLFRYYWVTAKLVLTLGAILVLLLHQFTAVEGAARLVADGTVGTLRELGRFGTQLVGDASAAIVVLVVLTVLGVYKPWGRTAYGRRMLELERGGPEGTRGTAADGRHPSVTEMGGSSTPVGVKILIAVIALLVILFVALHLVGGGLGGHGH